MKENREGEGISENKTASSEAKETYCLTLITTEPTPTLPTRKKQSVALLSGMYSGESLIYFLTGKTLITNIYRKAME